MDYPYHPRVLRLETPAAVRQEMEGFGVSGKGIAIMVPKGNFWAIRLAQVPAVQANVIKQEMLAKGGEAAVNWTCYLAGPESTSGILLLGTTRQFRQLIAKLRAQPRSMGMLPAAVALAEVIDRYSGHRLNELRLAGQTLTWGERTYVMGIINVTPDSFSGDGLMQGDAEARRETTLEEVALAQGRRQAGEGADILDVGGESTRPGAKPVPLEEELARVVPAIRLLAAQVDLPISIDSFKAAVVREALAAGAHLVNDIWGLRNPHGEGWNEELAAVVREAGVPIVLMHNRRARAAVGELGGHYPKVEYHDLMGEIVADLEESLSFAVAQGIPEEKVLVDPGIGFGKTPEQNLVVLRRLAELKSLGRPILLGTSRKSFIGMALKLPPEERLEGTLASLALGIANGADIVRVHDVREAVRAVRVSDAVVRQSE